MKADYWTNEGLFFHMGKFYGLNKNCQTVVVSQDIETSTQDNVQPLETPPGDSLDTPKPDVTDNSNPKCVICGNPVPGKRADRLYCSIKCRVKASRHGKQLEMVVQ
jgi:hypothetical protein